ncbi:nitrilase [Thecamonas trahens ATCC 50062]|uniref:Nitrilase n=1 Tax=Thecamonas trahens ATCC 50062 TaxID=461836 RepID=A0A0L0DEC8_THETB|nr:nitrilase [Thecamonas trahens ATCC 50062]KNC50516.1 nitrilase [Thecamonas trahens ATCC 50062]|eukprot:XP_013762408.1 nitrilase [Thecamonas trahens ATCC 50062]
MSAAAGAVGADAVRRGVVKVAAAQMCSTGKVAENMAAIRRLVARAVEAGASMLFLPECALFIGSSAAETKAAAVAIDGAEVAELATVAADAGLWLSVGGVHTRVADSEEGKVHNSHLVFDSFGMGSPLAVYHKAHLFDVDLPSGIQLHESRATEAGNKVVVVGETPVGGLGLGICYDMRFPGLFAAMRAAGADVVTAPSAFTVPTGEAHWHVLLRARAIESQCYMIAAAQVGKHNAKRESYGHTLIVDPWGKIVAEAADSVVEDIVVADIDLDYLDSVRASMPVFDHLRPELYQM